MSVDKLKAKLQLNRKKVMVSIRMPEDVVEDLKRIAPLLGFSGYQPLMRAYIGQGLRADLARLGEETELSRLVESLRRQGVNEDVLVTAVAEAKAEYRTD
ncbi:MAG: hypothetical protein H6654_16490 [Ardenticatenaceae bacterium]|nr:hypothetical protein [Anaerolineales bacterium]MCB8939757.1 hypothetical protein [Ardenticatenaceae bacterium]MCB8975159.1 hypothetical protein [Ardenticatenaceae bacterium]